VAPRAARAFTRALVCPPGRSFAQGLTEAGLGAPDLDLALEQHRAYCDALERCGLALTRLPSDDRFPDSTFVEDVAVVTAAGAVITRPGAESRRGEVSATRAALQGLVPILGEIAAPGRLDGGDVCEADDGFWIGLSRRTNAEGARQFAEVVGRAGFQATTIELPARRDLLHLRSGLASLGDGRLAAVDAIAGAEALRGYQILRVIPSETYAANCIRVNDHVLIAAGFPEFADTLARAGVPTLTLDVSEFRKMDGGLSCLSLRF
jgi:dimethylargininase